MDRLEIEAMIDKLESAKFFLDMKDMWSAEDYQTHNKYVSEIAKLKKELEVTV